MTTLKKQTVSGVKWLVGSSFLQKAIQTAATIVLARILGPSEFGLFALAFVAIDALGLFKSMGFDSALIQRKDNIEKAANTAFFIIPMLGIVLYAILAISAPWIGRFMNNTEVVGIIRALGIIFIISCLGKVPAALLEKNMRFARVTVIEVSTAIIYAVSAVTFALLGFKVWSLVIAYILKTLNQNILTFVFSGWRPKLEFDKQIAKEMFHFGKYLFLTSVVWFLKGNVDNILVGKLLGVTVLGLYAIAFNVANIGVDYLGGKVYRVTYSAYSKLQTDLQQLKLMVLKIFKYVGIVTIPLATGVFLLSYELLCSVYGSKWVEAATALRILSWGGAFNTLLLCPAAVFPACGKPKLTLWVIVLQVILFFLLIIPLARTFGITGVALVVTICGFISFLVTLFLAMKLLDMSIRQVYHSLKLALTASLVMTISIVLIRYALVCFHIILPPVFSFLLLSFIGVGVYGLYIFLIEKSIWEEMHEALF